MSIPDVPGRTAVWTIAWACVLLSCGLILTILQLTRGYQNVYASEPEVLMGAVLSVTLKWRVVVFWAEVIGLVGVLRVSSQRLLPLLKQRPAEPSRLGLRALKPKNCLLNR